MKIITSTFMALVAIQASALDVFVTWDKSPADEQVTEYKVEWKPTLTATNWIELPAVTNGVPEVKLPSNQLIVGQTLVARVTPRNFLGVYGPVSDPAHFTVPSGVATNAPMTRPKVTVVAK